MNYVIRIFTSLFYFTLLGKANMWLDGVSNTILAVGYRFFIIFNVLLLRFTSKFAICITLFIASLGFFILSIQNSVIHIIGCILIGIGVSLANYIIRVQTSRTISGAAHNKIAANIGSILSGILIILILHVNSNIFYILVSILLLMLSLLNYKYGNDNISNVLNINLYEKYNIKNRSKLHLLAWSLIGIVVGIKLFGVFTVLPQFLLNSPNSRLPNWYGIMIFINSFSVVLLQIPILHIIKRYFVYDYSRLKLTVVIMIFGMLLLAFPNLFKVNLFIGALLWTILLSVIECVISYLDVLSVQYNYMLVKEVSIGVGGGLTVFICRYFPQYGNVLIGFVGIIFIISFFIIVKNAIRESN